MTSLGMPRQKILA